MSKKRKNSNYVTEKRIQAREEAIREKKKAKIKRTLKPIIISAIVLILLAAIVVFTVFAIRNWGQSFEATHHASIEIEGYGTVHVELYGNEAPKTVENFVKLAKEGYYNGSDFHRIIEGIMAQGGIVDMVVDTITGEFSANGFDNPIKHRRGVISMARPNAYNGASSQFFIMHNDTSEFDGQYAAFGKVTDGMDIIDAICENAKPTDNNGSIAEADRPVIKSITIHEVH